MARIASFPVGLTCVDAENNGFLARAITITSPCPGPHVDTEGREYDRYRVTTYRRHSPTIERYDLAVVLEGSGPDCYPMDNPEFWA